MQLVPPQRIKIGKGNWDQKRPLSSLWQILTGSPVRGRWRQNSNGLGRTVISQWTFNNGSIHPRQNESPGQSIIQPGDSGLSPAGTFLLWVCLAFFLLLSCLGFHFHSLIRIRHQSYRSGFTWVGLIKPTWLFSRKDHCLVIVVQWLALSPHSKKVLGWNPSSGQSFSVFLSKYSQSKHMQLVGLG